MAFTEEHKKTLELRMIATIISGLEQDQLEIIELHILADAILKRIDHVKNHEELIEFLQDLVQQWPIFQPILESEQLSIHIQSK